MAEITKNDIKDVFVQSLEPFANAIQKDIQRLDEKIDGINSDLGGKIDKIDVRLTGVEKRLTGVEERLTGVEERLSNVEQDVKWMKENSSALFTKLDRFIAMYERQYQEFLAMNEHLNRMEKDFGERIKSLELRVQGV
jgi:predicted  nucleic acid-binding Zn-ribbon protein